MSFSSEMRFDASNPDNQQNLGQLLVDLGNRLLRGEVVDVVLRAEHEWGHGVITPEQTVGPLSVFAQRDSSLTVSTAFRFVGMPEHLVIPRPIGDTPR